MDTNNNSNRHYSLRSGGRTSSDDRDVGVGGNDRSSIGNDEDPPLSEYELLRLGNIQRNEARLLALGLIHNVPTKSCEEMHRQANSGNKENQRKKNLAKMKSRQCRLRRAGKKNDKK